MNDVRFDWPSVIRPSFEPGLSSVLEDGRLTLQGRRVSTTGIDLYALRLAEWAISSRRSLALCPPDPFGALPALIAAGAHVWSMAGCYAASGGRRAAGSDLRVVVATNNFRLRGIYRRLGVAGAVLNDVCPAATRSAAGTIAVLGGSGDRSWSTVFVSSPREVERVGDVDLAVVELPLHGAAETVAGLGVPVIAVAHDAGDQDLLKLAVELPAFGWDEDDLKVLDRISLVDGPVMRSDVLRLEQLARGVERRVVSVDGPAIGENAALFWQDLGPMLRAGAFSLLARELAAAAFVLFYDLLQLAVPTAAYEAATRPLRVRIREIEQAQRSVAGELRDLYLPMVAAELAGLAAAIGAESPKAVALRSLLRELTTKRKTVLLVARTAELARCYAAYFADSLDADRVRVVSLWELADEDPADVAVLLGMLPSAARHLYFAGIAAEVVVLAYGGEGVRLVEGEPFTEEATVGRALQYQAACTAWLARDAAQAACWRALSGETIEIDDPTPDPPRPGRRDAPGGDDGRPPEAPVGLSDGRIDILGELERRVERGLREEVGTDEPAEVEAMRVVFIDGRWLLLSTTGTVTRFTSSRVHDAGHPVAALRAGDELVLIDGEARKDLLAKVLEVAGELPEFAVPAAWVDYWRQALRRAYVRFGSYERLRDELHLVGCHKQTQTIRLWVVGATIGPDDAEDIRRLGEAIDDQPLMVNYQAIDTAIESLRSAHRALGQRLGSLARSIGGGVLDGTLAADDVIDERSGLTAADFRDSIEVVAVRSVEPAGIVPSLLTGRIHAATENGENLV